jgi:transposase
MLTLPSSVRIFLSPAPTDMRRGFDGLAALVATAGLDVYSGHLFVFLSKDRDRIKILTWDRGGFVLWAKRLERGRFKLPPLDPAARTVTLDAGPLAMILDGVDVAQVRRSKPWTPTRKVIDTTPRL